MARSTQTRVVMVTPGWSADCACVLSDKHSDYARAAVIAYWRMMDTATRHQLLRRALLLEPDVTEAKLESEPIRTVLFGQSSFRHPPGRFLGVQDLVLKFDSAKADAKGRPVGWALLSYGGAGRSYACLLGSVLGARATRTVEPVLQGLSPQRAAGILGKK